MKNPIRKTEKFFNQFNWNAVGTVGVILLLIYYVGCGLASCKKESSFTSVRGSRTIENDTHLKPAEGWNKTNRPVNYAEEVAKGRGKGKGHGKPVTDTTTGPPTDTTTQQPPTGGAVIYLDFDGQTVTGTSWNVQPVIDCKPSNQTPDEVAAIAARVKEDYAGFAVTVTTDSTVYWNANPYKRMRVIITESYEWYGQAGGVAYLGSFTWGDNTPCFVFNGLLGYSVKNVSDAVSHEAGHTLNLRHQGKCDGTQYNADIAADGKGYLMGYPYDKISGWQVGVTPYCVTQDDRLIINTTLAN